MYLIINCELVFPINSCYKINVIVQFDYYLENGSLYRSAIYCLYVIILMIYDRAH